MEWGDDLRRMRQSIRNRLMRCGRPGVRDLQICKLAKRSCAIQQVSEGGPGSGFIALSGKGGFGTVDEAVEMVFLRQCGGYTRRLLLAEHLRRFGNPWLTWMHLAVEKKFIKEDAKGNIGRQGDPCRGY